MTRAAMKVACGLIPPPLTIDASQKSFPFQFVHNARVDKITPITGVFDLHQFQKHRCIFGPGLRIAGKTFSQKSYVSCRIRLSVSRRFLPKTPVAKSRSVRNRANPAINPFMKFLTVSRCDLGGYGVRQKEHKDDKQEPVPKRVREAGA